MQPKARSACRRGLGLPGIHNSGPRRGCPPFCPGAAALLGWHALLPCPFPYHARWAGTAGRAACRTARTNPRRSPTMRAGQEQQGCGDRPSSCKCERGRGDDPVRLNRRGEALECRRLAAEAAFPGTGTGVPASAFKEPGGIGGTMPSSGPAADASGKAERLDADSARILRRQGRLSDADGRTRYNKSSKGWRRNGQEG